MSIEFSEFKEIITANPFISPATERELTQALADGQSFYMVPASIPPRLLENMRKKMKIVLIPISDFEALTHRGHVNVSDRAAEMGMRFQPGVMVYNEDEREP
jgi:hypothetical protein